MPARVADIEKAGIPCVLVSWSIDIQDITKNAFERLGIPTAHGRHLIIDSGYDNNVPASYSIPDLIKFLTAPLTADENKSGHYKPPTPPRIAFTGTLDEVQDHFHGHALAHRVGGPYTSWTDGLPFIPPTEKKVAQMLTGTSHPPDELVCKLIPEEWEVTVEKVAINGVMAGCKPEHMPILLAIVELGTSAAFASGSSFGALFVVSGPIAKEIGMNSGSLLMSPVNLANSTLSRAVWLMGINLGGKQAGVTITGSFGNATDPSLFIPESEDNPWTSLSEDRGFKREENTLSKFRGLWTLNMQISQLGQVPVPVGESVTSLEHLSKLLKQQENVQGTAILIGQSAIRKYMEKGFTTKQKFQDWLWDNTTRAYKEWATSYWFTYEKKQFGERGKRCWSEDYLNLPDDAQVPFFPSPESIHIIAAGAPDSGMMGVLHAHNPETVSIDKWR